ncbi:hypothetical protein [Kitasatospora sp. NBC_00315]|uniref:hypothetical protein n=1 Tax=Kitasatospora sp. NBC_00315 TaxID=2975963 RepID=UPI00324CCD7F
MPAPGCHPAPRAEISSSVAWLRTLPRVSQALRACPPNAAGGASGIPKASPTMAVTRVVRPPPIRITPWISLNER